MKNLYTRREVFKNLEIRDDAVFRTEYVCTVWVSLAAIPQRWDGGAFEKRIAQQLGGDSLVSPSNRDYDYNWRRFDRADEFFKEQR